MNWTVNITFKQDNQETLKSICETHELKGYNFLEVIKFAGSQSDAGLAVESLSIWLDDTDEVASTTE